MIHTIRFTFDVASLVPNPNSSNLYTGNFGLNIDASRTGIVAILKFDISDYQNNSPSNLFFSPKPFSYALRQHSLKSTHDLFTKQLTFLSNVNQNPRQFQLRVTLTEYRLKDNDGNIIRYSCGFNDLIYVLS